MEVTLAVLLITGFSLLAGCRQAFGAAASGYITDRRHSSIASSSSSSLFDQGPEIISRGQTIRAAVGERVTLPCQVKNLGKSVLVWQKGSDVLTAASLKVTPDERFHLVSKHNIQIRGIRAQDAGDYTCKIPVLGNAHITITHTLEILIPPTIRPEPPNGNYVVKKGRRVELKCLASGNPHPKITWTRKNDLLPGGISSNQTKILVIDSVDRHEAGIYICEASNGVGQKASATINLQVLYPPEIDLETDRVHSGENKEAHLTCLIHGNPTPTVRWMKDNRILQPTEDIRITSSANRHTLILRAIRSGLDFGNYSCIAENSLGTFKKHIEVHGRPTPAVFRSSPEVGGRSYYTLTWSVDSYSPIDEYRLLYRRIQPYHKISDISLQGGGDWTNVIIPGDRSPDHINEFNHRQSYRVKDLEQDAEYECLVQARNQFGWSEASRIFHFFTGKREAAVRDLEWKSGSRGLTAMTTSILLGIIVVFAAKLSP